MDRDTLSHVFISYSRRQQDYARRLAAHLGTRHGIPVWMDDELITGDRWENVIKTRIDECAALVVVMSHDAEASPWVSREIARAQSRGKPVLPVLFNGDVFFRLADVQFEDVRGGTLPSEQFITALRQATGTAADTPRITTSPAAKPVRGDAARKRTAARMVATTLAASALVGAVALWIATSDDGHTPPGAQMTSSPPESSSIEHVQSTTYPTTTTTTDRTQYRGQIRVYNNSTIRGLGARAAETSAPRAGR